MMERLSQACGRDVSRETFDRLKRFAELLVAENQRQNLVATNSIENLWERHIVDGAQLARLAPPGARWVDIGSGAGLPGVVLAIVTSAPVTLVEPRRLRAEFLERVKAEMGLDNVTVRQSMASKVGGQYDVITARAVAPLGKLFEMTGHMIHSGTIYLLPKGKSAQSELAEAKRTWQGVFRLEPSITSDEAAILVATDVTRKGSQ